jgi:hypothetical protein
MLRCGSIRANGLASPVQFFVVGTETATRQTAFAAWMNVEEVRRFGVRSFVHWHRLSTECAERASAAGDIRLQPFIEPGDWMRSGEVEAIADRLDERG